MMSNNYGIASEVKAFCAHLGKSELLVQGAGGNISWKDTGTLWVKGSGTWLARAEKEQIFVPVDLLHLQSALRIGNFKIAPKLIETSTLSPSIETLLHALMPQTVVLHLHPVEVLTHLVRVDAFSSIERFLGDRIRWTYVPYYKPGAELARGVLLGLERCPDAEVVFLANHGVVIGGKDVEAVSKILDIVVTGLQSKPASFPHKKAPGLLQEEMKARGYDLIEDTRLNQLAMNRNLARRLVDDWALYPDHVVFLGPKAIIFGPDVDFEEIGSDCFDGAPFVFLIGDGVYKSSNAASVHDVQLSCYYEQLIRQRQYIELKSLEGSHVAELLDWDAEKLRKKMSE